MGVTWRYTGVPSGELWVSLEICGDSVSQIGASGCSHPLGPFCM